MSDASAIRLTMQDPRTQYPRPPFPEQPQSAPGLAAKMDPVPDQGEHTYVGHNRLPGRKALVTGADSGIGAPAALGGGGARTPVWGRGRPWRSRARGRTWR